MAALIGNVFTDSSRFHNMVGGIGLQHTHDSHYHATAGRPRDREIPSSQPRSSTTPTQPSICPDWETTTPGPSGNPPQHQHHPHQQQQQQQPRTDGCSRLPSPPSSSSPSEASSAGVSSQHGTTPRYMASTVPISAVPAQIASSPAPSAAASSVCTTSTATTVIPAKSPSQQIPSPTPDTDIRWKSGFLNPLPDPPSSPPVQTTIQVRDLAHIQSLAQADIISGNGPGILNDAPLQAMKYEISGMPIADIIEMVAALLTKITTTNDQQHDALNRNAAHIRQAQSAVSRSEDGSSGGGHDFASPLSSSVLAFHGKNVPAITILSYLSRINKYCPTTYEVFLSLLVYFDRMTQRVNDLVMKTEEARRQTSSQSQSRDRMGPSADVNMGDGDDSDELDSDLADDDDNEPGNAMPSVPPTGAATSPHNNATYFVVDSYNIHRLIISGVTCASKFFSDVFYTNSRYAKVGGLPLAELNHLELQFLLLNDFRLAVAVEDLEAYATMLVEFYAREVVQKTRPS